MGLTASQRLQLWWGKVRRLYLATFRPGYVRESRARREGECQRCGACCALGVRCPCLRRNGHGTECAIHGVRPTNCRLFPIDERDLADRDLLHPEAPCGFHFNGHDNSAADPPSS